ncbi:hypothetical protein EDB80DRAFT_80390 [Ilyonectria destructans]|nr:hypothetical protein EDB80DRAFT_80390 [Ilyonectria destructans]
MRHSLPGVIEDDGESLGERQEELGRPGKPRTSPKDLPEYLVRFLEGYLYDFPDPEIITAAGLDSQLQAMNFRTVQDLEIELFQKQAAPWKQKYINLTSLLKRLLKLISI